MRLRSGLFGCTVALLVSAGPSPCVGPAPSAAPAGSAAPARSAGDAPLVVVLCYHDVSETSSARDAVTPETLRKHLRTLRDEGWEFRTLAHVLAAGRQGSKLPDRTAVLTFDDGYRSFLTEALPILREARVPASLAVITGFVDAPPLEMAPLLTWDELREVQASGLVEIISHSHALHRHEVANPQGLTAPSVTTRIYVSELGRYETRDEYRDRILADLMRSRTRLMEELGVEARILAWPYGEHNEAVRGLAREAGYDATLGLEGAPVTRSDLQEGYLSRLLVTRNDSIGAPEMSWLYPGQGPMRPAEVNLDALYDADPDRLVANIERTIEDLWDREVSDVFLSVCADPTRTGFLEETYFMNHQTRVRADIWSMVAIRMKRAGFRVWARVPALNLAWEWARHPEWRLAATPAPAPAPAPGVEDRWPFRLSPELPDVARAGGDFLNDLAVYTPLDGIVFDGDTRLGPQDCLASDPDADEQTKAEVLEGYLVGLERTVLAWRPHCVVVRPRQAPDDQFSSSSRGMTSTR